MAEKTSKIRDFSLDNIRFFLIFTVVFAHLLEIFRAFSGSVFIYQFIYSFHMPVFIFLFGYNVKFSPKKIIFRWFIPYLIFQSAYILFSKYALKIDTKFQYTTPFWLLWYMLACIFYQLILPLINTDSKRKQALILTLSFVIALVVGFEESIGYYLSLSRIFVFMPWFLLGYYFKKNGTSDVISSRKKLKISLLISAVVIIVLSAVFLYYSKINNGLLYGSLPYSKCNGTITLRAAIFLIAFSILTFLFIGLKGFLNKRLFLITNIGQNTLPVFLLHGFIIKALPVYFPDLLQYPLITLLLSFVILLIFGNKLFNKAVYYIGFSWLERFF